jgi:hypothetical protein
MLASLLSNRQSLRSSPRQMLVKADLRNSACQMAGMWDARRSSCSFVAGHRFPQIGTAEFSKEPAHQDWRALPKLTPGH